MDLHRLTRRVLIKAAQFHNPSRELIHKLCLQEDTTADAELVKRVVIRVLASLEPSSQNFVVVPENCTCGDGEHGCTNACAVDAIRHSPDGKVEIIDELCVDCGLCVDACEAGAIVDKSHCRELAEMMSKRQRHPLYAILAPAFAGQFGPNVSDAQVRSGLRRLGFTDVYEVALAADILTAMEADEFVERSHADGRFMITSCCCPAFIKLVEKHRPKLLHLISEAVSPMVALGRLLKSREPDCRVVFIGPCLAKRAESRRSELSDAIDSVLTFKETVELFELAGIDLNKALPDIESLNQASRDGRNYAHTGGVTEAIRNAVVQLAPELKINALIGNGLKQCNEILREVEEGHIDGNFMEGMGCPGGCVGGPGTVAPSPEGAEVVRSYAVKAKHLMARDNEFAMEWFDQYGQKEMLLPKKS